MGGREGGRKEDSDDNDNQKEKEEEEREDKEEKKETVEETQDIPPQVSLPPCDTFSLLLPYLPYI